MNILESIIATVKEDAPIKEVCIGPFWTAVVSRRCGLSSTLLGFEEEQITGPPIKEAGLLKQNTALELKQYLKSNSFLERSVGLASLNSLINFDSELASEINAAEVLAKFGRDKKVCVVGHFPFINKLREQVGKLWVLEKSPRLGDLPAHEAERIVPEADVIAITSTALLNGTMNSLLNLRRKGTLTMVLGPSTPISPVWFDYGVHLVSGTVVTEPETAMHLISEGCTFKQFRGRGVKTVTLPAPGLKLD